MRAVRRAFHAHADLRFALRAGFPQDHHGAQRLGKQPGNEVNVLRSIFLPELPNLKFRDAHKPDSTLECPTKGVNCLQPARYTLDTPQQRDSPRPLLSVATFRTFPQTSNCPSSPGIGNLPAPSNIVVNGALQVPARRFRGVYSWVGGGSRYAIDSAARPEVNLGKRPRGRSGLRPSAKPGSPQGSTEGSRQGTACRQRSSQGPCRQGREGYG